MKIIKKMLVSIIILLYILGIKYCYAQHEDIKNQIEKYEGNIDKSDLTQEEILNTYEKFSQNYTNEEMINLLEENKEELNKKGINDETIEAGKALLKNTDEEQIKEIIQENVNIEDIQEKLEKGYTANEIVESILDEMPTQQKINTAGKIILSNKIIKKVLILIIILFIYGTIMRAIIFNKAGENPIAAFIPIYRQITMYRICDLSLGYMLLWLLPIIGWIMLFVIALMKRIYLSQNFGKGVLFGIGLILFPPIFQSILAFNKNIKYED